MAKAVIYVFIGGGFGAASRFLIGRLSVKLYAGDFPLGTLLANVISCILAAAFIYGYSAKMDGVEKDLYLFLIVGFCGGLSTFSTFSLETFELIKQGLFLYATLNIILSISLSLMVVYFLYSKLLSH